MTAARHAGRDHGYYLASALGLMVAGLIWRLVPFGLPAFWLRHGGNAIWGAMVFCIVAMIRAGHWTRPTCLLGASLIAIGSEFFRLYHMPWLDAFRLTLPGALLIGRIFSIWNIVDYEVGIVVAGAALWRRPKGQDRRLTPP